MSATDDTSPVVKDLSDLHSLIGPGNLAQAIADHAVPWQPGPASFTLAQPPHAAANVPVFPSTPPPGQQCPPPSSAPGFGLTIKSLDEILATVADDSDMILGDRLIARGQSCGLMGASGLGKSRLAQQLACSLACGAEFLGFANHAPPLRVLMLQTENSARRLKLELDRMRVHFAPQWDTIRQNLWIQKPETDADYLLNLDDDDNLERVADAVASRNPDVLFLDPLNVLAAGDLNKDVDMRRTCMAITEETGFGKSKAYILIKRAEEEQLISRQPGDRTYGPA